jgi:uncharacterized protein (UPF0332 family)
VTEPEARPAAEHVQAWAKAGRHLTEAEAMDLALTPAAAVHSAYYAMHLAARAVLLLLDGEQAPTRHGSVIGRFGQIATAATSAREALMQAGRDLNRMYEERVSADYDVAELTSADVARESLAKARHFLATCASAFGDGLDKQGYR